MMGSLAIVSVSKMQKNASALLALIQMELFDKHGTAEAWLAERNVATYNYGLALLDYLHAWNLTLEWVMNPYKPTSSEKDASSSIVNEKPMKHLTEQPGTVLMAPLPKLMGADELSALCYRWLAELGIPSTASIDEVIIRFAPAFAGRNRGNDYLRSMFLGGIGEGYLVTCQTPKGKIFEISLSDPTVLAVLRDGGRATWNGITLKAQEVAEPALN